MGGQIEARADTCVGNVEEGAAVKSKKRKQMRHSCHHLNMRIAHPKLRSCNLSSVMNRQSQASRDYLTLQNNFILKLRDEGAVYSCINGSI
jgi:hypothetical protein